MAAASTNLQKNSSSPLDARASASTIQRPTLTQMTESFLARDARIMKKAYALGEIIHQEEYYFANLQELDCDFFQPIFQMGILSPEAEDDICGTLRRIMSAHSEIQDAITEMKQKSPPADASIEEITQEWIFAIYPKNLGAQWLPNTILQVFHKINDAMKDYKSYVTGYDVFMEKLAAFRDEMPDFAQFLREKEQSKQSMYSFLMLPVQQISRYHLTFGKLHDWTSPELDKEYTMLDSILSLLETIPHTINEYKRDIERKTQLNQIMALIQAMPENLVDDQRRYLTRVKLRKRNKGALSRSKFNFLFLFNDILIITNQRFKFRKHHFILDCDLKLKDEVVTLNAEQVGGKGEKTSWNSPKLNKAEDFVQKFEEAYKKAREEDEWDDSAMEPSVSRSQMSAISVSRDSTYDTNRPTLQGSDDGLPASRPSKSREGSDWFPDRHSTNSLISPSSSKGRFAESDLLSPKFVESGLFLGRGGSANNLNLPNRKSYKL